MNGATGVSRGEVGTASGLHPTLRKSAKDGAPEPLGLVKGGPPAMNPTHAAHGWGTRRAAIHLREPRLGLAIDAYDGFLGVRICYMNIYFGID